MLSAQEVLTYRFLVVFFFFPSFVGVSQEPASTPVKRKVGPGSFPAVWTVGE